MNRYVASLDGVRAFAVLSVVLSHGNVPFTAGGKTGVLVFFALSGYLITSILIRERESAGRVSIKAFYARRARRLYPAMLIATALYALVAFARHDTRTLAAVPAGLFYFLNWFNIASDAGVGVLGHYWSLSVEEQFYLVWPFLMLAAYRLWKVRGVMWFALLGAAASYAVKWLFFADSYRQTGTDFAADALLLGCALAAAMKLHPQLVGASARRLFYPALVALAAALVLGDSTSHATHSEQMLFARLWWPAATLSSCVVVAACVTAGLPRWATRTLEWRPVVYLGRISYGLYLYHVLVLNLFAWAIPGGGRVALARLVLVLPVAVAGSAASFELVEKRFLRRRPPHREAAAAPVAARAL